MKSTGAGENLRKSIASAHLTLSPAGNPGATRRRPTVNEKFASIQI